MHEYSIVGALVDCVARAAAARGATAVRSVTVRIGELAGVDADLLRSAYLTFRPATICSGADLTIETVAAEWRCGRCGRQIAAGAVLACPACGVPARLRGGDDILLDRIELEVPDV